jgi:DNA polymerase delta subunit 3
MESIKYSELIRSCRGILNSHILWSATKKPRPHVPSQQADVKKSMSGPTKATPRSPLSKKSSSSSQVGKKTTQKSFFSAKSKGAVVPESALKTSTRSNDSSTEAKEPPKEAEKKGKPLKIIKMDSSNPNPVVNKKPFVDVPLIPKEPMIVSKQSAAQADQIKQMFEDEEEEGTTEKADPEADNTAPQTETRRVRKRRKIVRSKTFMDGKYMVTKDVEEWESYSEDETVPIGKSASKMIKIDSSVKGPKNQQRSIRSFFTTK